MILRELMLLLLAQGLCHFYMKINLTLNYSQSSQLNQPLIMINGSEKGNILIQLLYNKHLIDK